jgi:hypothetical protein
MAYGAQGVQNVAVVSGYVGIYNATAQDMASIRD